ncbi:MAG: hypothetical protein EA422_07665 [Gemmatimonadales bacterium]|nr:MAG: hypothetical protein EA422_07665 [Gemmatimonadales bacterium]
MEEGFDRAALDRVIRRASELQFSADGEADRPRLSEDEILRIGGEVGLDPEHLRRAMGEVRAESLLPASQDEGKGFVDRMVGPAIVRASRVVAREPEPLLRTMEEYLDVGESLRRIRKQGNRSRWAPAEGMLASLQRGLNWGGRTYELARCSSVEMSIEGLGDGRSVVALVADHSKRRAEATFGWTAGLGLGGGLGLGLGLGLVTGIGPLLVAPGLLLGVGTGAAAARADYGKESARIRLALEGILDRLEAGEPLLGGTASWRDRLIQG